MNVTFVQASGYIHIGMRMRDQHKLRRSLVFSIYHSINTVLNTDNIS